METNKTFTREVFFTEAYNEFYNSLPEQAKVKFDRIISVIQNTKVIPANLVCHLINTEFYELRVKVSHNEYRSLLFTINHNNIMESTSVILLNGFFKKDTKDYRKAISIARTLISNYKSTEDEN